VAWVAPANLTQRGGSVLTLDDGQGHFDGIVFGELAAGKWMAGSDNYRRTEKNQDAWQTLRFYRRTDRACA
jgi:beta-fructofuranosidase